MSSIILGVDPGLQNTGYAILKHDSSKTQVVDFGYLKLDSSKEIAMRIETFYAFFTQKITEIQVTHIAIETPFLGKNAQTFLKLGYLRGILYLLAQLNKCQLSEFAPREVKMAVTGFGAASKEQVSTMMLRMFQGLNTVKATARADVTDALAVSVCGLFALKNTSLDKRIHSLQQKQR